jgi:integrase
MGRPPLPRGTYGEIACHQVGPSNYKARARFRDSDGVTRPVARFGQTKGAAISALREALRDRMQAAGGAQLTGSAKIASVAQQWLEDVRASNRAVGTKQHYAYAVDRYVVRYFGDLRVEELDAGLCDRLLKRITANHGPSAAKTARSALSGALGLAVLHGALASNPVREATPITVRRGRSKARALTPDQETELCDRLRSHTRAVQWDLPDLVDWMLATGCRIGEALTIRDGVNDDGLPLLDLDANTWEVDSTALRMAGVGMVVQLRPKSVAGWRRIAVPPFAIEMMRGRQTRRRLQPEVVRLLHDDETITEARGMWVALPAPKSRGLRDPSNTQADLREVLDGLDCDACAGTGYQLQADGTFALNAKGHRQRCRVGPWAWITSHTFRKTVVTRLLRAGVPPEEVADHVGHDEPSMTLNVYAGRDVVTGAAARILDR